MSPNSAKHPDRIGIYGGTFDPPHLGHLILAETAAGALNLARVLFVPAAQPPHKAPGDIRTPAHHRLAMVERAVAGNPRFALSRADMDRPGPHYSVDMLRLLRREFPEPEFVFLIGADSLDELPTWSRPLELLALAWLGVMRRPGATPDLQHLERTLPGLTERVLWVDAPEIGISATGTAERVATGRSIRYLTPDAVCDYIEENKLYRKSEHGTAT
ncbi:MAG: nicotinate (nicotinamide) nucleotide adenylyltransferase [Chloroflexi bacterium]|nr:nicotinate (nicotinamide) nucleotide adenylyltransferase [Chloroflexota bacterium]